MLIKISWKNIWRNKLRSAVVIMSIVVGLWAGVLSMALFNGMSIQRTQTAIETNLSHIQVHNRAYQIDNDAWNFITDTTAVFFWLDQNPKVKNYCTRMLIQGMSSSPQGAFGVTITGIDPEKEAAITAIHQKLDTGNYFQSGFRNPVLIGQKLADKLKVRLRSKIILTFQDKDGMLTAGAFRVCGIFKSGNTQFDQATLFVKKQDLAKIYGEIQIHETGIFLHNIDDSKAVSESFNSRFSDDQAQYWAELAPELGYANDIMDQMLYIFVMIIMLSMAFGIINSMLMAVLERRHELGMLMCIGMSKWRVFSMIVWETIFIALIGGPLGLLAAVINVHYLEQNGVDLSVVGEGLENFGISSIVYPTLGPEYYFNVTIMIVLTAILSALYPAFKAVRYNPAEAIRSL